MVWGTGELTNDSTIKSVDDIDTPMTKSSHDPCPSTLIVLTLTVFQTKRMGLCPLKELTRKLTTFEIKGLKTFPTGLLKRSHEQRKYLLV